MQKQKQSPRLKLKTSTVVKLAPTQLERAAGAAGGSGQVCTTRVVEEPGGP
jgi:hypothetical protein